MPRRMNSACGSHWHHDAIRNEKKLEKDKKKKTTIADVQGVVLEITIDPQMTRKRPREAQDPRI